MIEWLVLVLVGLLLFQLFRHRSDFQFFTLLSALLAILTILVVPHLGYEFLNDLEITRLFHKQMRVPEGVYFSLVQPIIVSYSLGVLWFSFRSGSRKSQIDKLTSIIRALSDLDWMRLILLFLIFAGTHSFRSMAPSSLEFIFYLFGSLKFGVVMVMVAKARYLWLRILLLIGIPLSFALQGGMFQAYLATILAIAVILNLLKSPRTVLIASFVTIPFLFLLLLAKKELRIDAKLLNNGNALNFHSLLFNKYVKKQITKYNYPINKSKKISNYPDNYILAILQMPDDTVSSLSFLSVKHWLNTVYKFTKKNNINLVVKLHPKDKSTHFLKIINLIKTDESLMITKDPIHAVIAKSLAVVTTNSGAGFEALLHHKPVITCGKSDYNSVSIEVRNEIELENKLKSLILNKFKINKNITNNFLQLYCLNHCITTQDLDNFVIFNQIERAKALELLR